jgi:thiamine biosynthesis lipoprotein
MEKSEVTFFAMGTVVSLAAYGTDARQALEASQLIVEELDRLLSHTKDDSELSRLNRLGENEWLAVHEDVAAALDESVKYAEKTGGVFDPTMGALIDLWAACGKKKQIPDRSEIMKALASCDFRNIEEGRQMGDADKGGGSSYLPSTPPSVSPSRFRLENGARLHLGGIGKGFAADRVCDLCRSEDVHSALFSFGTSSIAALGGKPDGKPWKIGLRATDDERIDCFGVVSIKDQFLSTSGDYEHYDIIDGQRYHHILDVNTGYPADSGLRSVTVMADSGAESEAYSTALFVMGLDKALDFHLREGGFEAIFVTAGNRVVCTRGAKEIFEFRGREIGYEYDQ